MTRWLPLLLLCACAAASARERYALLVGVAALPALPAATWLSGPPRDLTAMRAALLQQGFADERIISLGSSAGDAQLPTRAAILARLDQFARTIAADDVLVLYWSGHALLLPGYPGKQASPLGHGVQLLTRDSRVDAGGRQLAGGVSSAEIGHAIDAIAARRAQVVAVFDTCHAAGGTRGDADALTWRGLEPADIGWLPRGSMAGASTSNAIKATGASTAKNGIANAAGLQSRPRFVGFYASEAQQRAPEARVDGASGQAAGLFTRAVIAALRTMPDNYQMWARATAQHYRAALGELHLPISIWPSPVFAGALDAPLWHAGAGPALWPVRRDTAGWFVPYGLLDGLHVGDSFDTAGARWRVDSVNWGEARLGVVAGGGAPVVGWARRTPVALPVFARVLARLRTSASGRARIAALLALPATPGAALVDAHIDLRVPGKPAQRLALADRDLGALPAGTRIRVVVENRGAQSVDLGLAHLSQAGAPSRIYPPFGSDSNRMPPGIAPEVSHFEQDFEVIADAAGPEWLALVAAPATNGAPPRRFALLDGLQDLPTTRGGADADVKNPDLAQVARLSWTTVRAPSRR